MGRIVEPIYIASRKLIPKEWFGLAVVMVFFLLPFGCLAKMSLLHFFLAIVAYGIATLVISRLVVLFEGKEIIDYLFSTGAILWLIWGVLTVIWFIFG